MKKVYLLLLLAFFISFNAAAQIPSNELKTKNSERKINLQHIKVGKLKLSEISKRDITIDTIGNLQTCDTVFYNWFYFAASGDTAWVSGHNDNLDSAKAEKYTGVSGDKINALWMFFGYASYVSSTLNVIHVKVWDDSGVDGTPGVELGSVDVTHATIKADVDAGNLTTVTFLSPINIPANGNFYCGFKMDYKKKNNKLIYDGARAVNLFNPDFFNDCNSQAENTAWELYSKTNGQDGKWHDYIYSWGYGTRNPIFPIIEKTTCAISISPASVSICKKKSTTLTASGADNYIWSPADGLNTTIGATVIADPTVTTTYTVTGNDGLCTNTVTVTVTDKPKSVISAAPCSGGAVLLTCTPTPNTGVTFKWSKDGNNISGSTNATYSATTNGNYKCKVTITATGCTKKSKGIDVVINCKTLLPLNVFEMKASPNPFSENLFVNILSPLNETATIMLMDLTGKLVKQYLNVDAALPFLINEKIASGIYFLKVMQGANSKIIKIVKQ